MNILTSPGVRLISAPIHLAHPRYELPDHSVDAENIVAQAGKVCYDSYSKDGRAVDAHVRGLVESGHHSVLEHVHLGLFMEGISRGCSHEIVRHRMFNYSQRSTRYTAEDDAAIVLDPYYADLYHREKAAEEDPEASPLSGEESDLLNDFIELCYHSLEEYRRQVERLERLNPKRLTGRDLRKWCRGKARQLAPHALETRMVMTGNLRAWRHFLVMRTSRHAEAEIRRLAHAVWCVISSLAPSAFCDFETVAVDGYIEITTPR
jgi:thymidylate synthase (FAD)